MSEKGFLNKIGGMFVEISDDEPKEQPKSIGIPSLNVIPTSIGTPPITNTSDNQELEKFMEHFEKLFDQANIPGPDYYEFDKMVKLMGNTLSDEVKMPAAFGGLSSQGLTKDILISTANQYISVIEEDQKNFEAKVGNVVSSDIQIKKDNLINLAKTITDSQNMIEKLKKDIEDDKNKLASLQLEIQNDENKISQKLNSYKIASENKKQQIQNNINQIQKYIK